MTTYSAGILLYRCIDRQQQVLLVHPGGPFWARKDAGAWSIPKGLCAAGEEPLAAARREFREETGQEVDGEFLDLGEARQDGGKLVHVFAVESDLDATSVVSNTVSLEWPPRSSRRQAYPEVDRAQWFEVATARVKIVKGQSPFLDRLAEAVACGLPANSAT